MLNRKLFNSKRDAEIARLKMAIAKFKKYDQERKQYYADKMQRLGELESYAQEIDTETEIGKLKATIVNLKKQLGALSMKLQVYRIEEKRTPEELSDIISRDSLRQKNKQLNAEVVKLRKEKSEWIKQKFELNKNL